MKYFEVLAGAAVLLGLFTGSAAQESTSSDLQQSRNSSVDKSDQEIELGSAVYAPAPRLPKSLRHKKGAVVLGATLKTDGTFTDVSALAGDREFQEAALDSVHHWQYNPATENGMPTDADVFVIFSYRDGDVRTVLRPNPPFPTKPKIGLNELASRGELFTVVDPHVMKVPKAIYSPDPEYSETARVARYQGVCLLGVIVDKDGNPSDVWVERKLGLGLDQKALEAVKQWKFEPAMKAGEPVAVRLNIEVSFKLY